MDFIKNQADNALKLLATYNKSLDQKTRNKWTNAFNEYDKAAKTFVDYSKLLENFAIANNKQKYVVGMPITEDKMKEHITYVNELQNKQHTVIKLIHGLVTVTNRLGK